MHVEALKAGKSYRETRTITAKLELYRLNSITAVNKIIHRYSTVSLVAAFVSEQSIICNKFELLTYRCNLLTV